jgi:hypothetical protein
MNERIKELAEQAQQYAEYVTPQGCEWFDTFKEKFAELIVQECAEVAHCNFHVDGVTLGNIMKEHFGVEE